MTFSIRFNLLYFLLSILIFAIEVLIATVFKNIVFVRAYLGDVIVVWLLYTFVLSFLAIKNKTQLANWILLFAFAIEFSQYFKIADLLGFKPGSVMYILMGNSFSWWDMLCYLVGVICIWSAILVEKKYKN